MISHVVSPEVMRETQTWKDWERVPRKDRFFSDHLMTTYPFITCHYTANFQGTGVYGFVIQIDESDLDQLTWMLLSL